MDAFKRIKTLYWVGSSKKDLQALPEDVQDIFGFALHQAQEGGKHLQVKCLKGFAGAGVLEVVEDYNRSTYRAVYRDICICGLRAGRDVQIVVKAAPRSRREGRVEVIFA
ncbi:MULTISPECIES: type II toxin-antitoxin system RelE/ParE family toxin [unclassified Pseudomonas]|uniref:type II toxin-antitoxin system RelE/ParE family toxin n=1 Tax=unclassified Pseudomonas TaxID=196821 RepID=UPI00117B2F4A|nr:MULTISPECIES: type II toxin-antitoxin system RelE/ParE family toxin [unclassified Pseudomonas]